MGRKLMKSRRKDDVTLGKALVEELVAEAREREAEEAAARAAADHRAAQREAALEAGRSRSMRQRKPVRRYTPRVCPRLLHGHCAACSLDRALKRHDLSHTRVRAATGGLSIPARHRQCNPRRVPCYTATGTATQRTAACNARHRVTPSRKRIERRCRLPRRNGGTGLCRAVAGAAEHGCCSR